MNEKRAGRWVGELSSVVEFDEINEVGEVTEFRQVG